MILLHDQHEDTYASNGLGALDNWVVSGEVHWVLNGEYTLSMRYPIHAFLGMDIAHGMQVEVLLPNYSDVFRIKKISKNMGYLDIFAEHKSYDLIDNFIHDINIVGKTGQMAMDQISAGMAYPHPFQLKSEIGTLNSARMVRLGGMQAIMDNGTDNSFANRWGGEFERHYNTITNKRQIGTNRHVKIEYAKDLLGYTAEVDTSEIVTRIIPVGFDGLLLPERYVDSPLMDPEMPKIRLMHYDDIKAASGEYADDEDAVPMEEALAALRIRASEEYSVNNVDKPRATYTVDFVLLSDTQEYERVAVLQEVQGGDLVEVHHYNDDFHASARVHEYSREILKGSYTEMRLGDIGVSLVNDIATKRDIARAVEQSIADNSTFLDALRDDIESAWRNEDGYNYELKADNAYGLPAGYYSFDRAIDDHPTAVIGISAGRLVIANRKDANGDFVFTTFGTGDGLAADMVGAEQIMAGAINTEHLSAGAITAGMINLSSGNTLEQELSLIVSDKSVIHTQIPPQRPYSANQIWVQPKVNEADRLQWTEKNEVAWGLSEADLVGQRVYVCVNSKAEGEPFHMSDFELVADGPEALRNMLTRIQEYSVEITDQYINLSETIKQIMSGDTTAVLEQYNLELTARQATLESMIRALDESIESSRTDIEAWGQRIVSAEGRIDDAMEKPDSYVGWPPPKPPYKTGDQWSTTVLSEAARSWSERSETIWGLSEQDLLGGRSYVCIKNNTSGDFRRSDWVNVGSDGQVISEVNRLVTDIMAGKIMLSSQTKLDGTWQIGTYQLMTPEYTQWGHRDGSYTRAGYEGFQRFVAGTGKTYHYMQHQIRVKGWDDAPIRVVLPADCRGKDFEVTLAPSETGVPYTKSEWDYYLRYGVHKPGAMASAMRRSITRFTITLDPTRAQPIDKLNGVVWVKCYKNMHQVDHETGAVTEFMTELNATITITY